MSQVQDHLSDVAVIVPCYNYGHFIEQTLRTVLRQTHRAAEVIVVDDGSTDNTREACGRFPEATYLWKPNGGASSARNHGLAHSSSDLVMFLDADDLLEPDALEALARAHRAGRDVPVHAVFGMGRTFTEVDGTYAGVAETIPLPEELAPFFERDLAPDVHLLDTRVLRRFVRSSVAPQCSALVSRSVYERIGQWDPAFPRLEDHDMWMRIASRFRLAYLSRVVSSIRKHDSNATHPRNWHQNRLEIMAILQKAMTSGDHPLLERLARRQYAREAYRVGQRLADAGRWREASAMMARSFRRRPTGWKAWAHWVHYGLRGLLRRGG